MSAHRFIQEFAACALVLERVEALLGDTQEVRLVDLQVMRLDDRAVERFGEQLPADLFLERRMVRANETALAGDRLDDALALQLRVRLGDRVAVDAQLLGERPDAGQRLAGWSAPDAAAAFTWSTSCR